MAGPKRGSLDLRVTAPPREPDPVLLAQLAVLARESSPTAPALAARAGRHWTMALAAASVALIAAVGTWAADAIGDSDSSPPAPIIRPADPYVPLDEDLPGRDGHGSPDRLDTPADRLEDGSGPADDGSAASGSDDSGSTTSGSDNSGSGSGHGGPDDQGSGASGSGRDDEDDGPDDDADDDTDDADDSDDDGDDSDDADDDSSGSEESDDPDDSGSSGKGRSGGGPDLLGAGD